VDGHPNEIGHRIASEVLFRALLTQKLIPEAYVPQHQSGPIEGTYRASYEKLNPAGRGKKTKASEK
jgi:hypothetical protein